MYTRRTATHQMATRRTASCRISTCQTASRFMATRLMNWVVERLFHLMNWSRLIYIWPLLEAKIGVASWVRRGQRPCPAAGRGLADESGPDIR
jgi:hypothetical protein